MLFLLASGNESDAISPENRDPLFGSNSKPWILDGRFSAPKRKPGQKGPGNAFTAAQYSQESLKNNVLVVNWLAVWPEKTGGTGLLHGLGRIDAP
jgi:hypothetical protein